MPNAKTDEPSQKTVTKTVTEFPGVSVRSAVSVFASDPSPDTLSERIAAKTGLSETRLAHMVALVPHLRSPETIRAVRVFAGTSQNSSDITVDEHYYVIDKQKKPLAITKKRPEKQKKQFTKRRPRPPSKQSGKATPSSGEGWSLTRAPRECTDRNNKPGRPKRSKRPRNNPPPPTVIKK